jgi:hypothetical protein
MKITSAARSSTAVSLCLALCSASFGSPAWAQLAAKPATSESATAELSRGVRLRSFALDAGVPLSHVDLLPPAAAPSLPPSAATQARPGVAAPTESGVASAEGASISEGLAPLDTAAALADEAGAYAERLPDAPRKPTAFERAARRVAELKAAFERRVDSLATPDVREGAVKSATQDGEPAPHYLAPTSAADKDKVAQGGGDTAPPTPPSDPKKPAFGWFGLGTTVATLIGALLIMQVGLEAQGASMAQLTENAFGDFSILAQVSIFSSIGSMIGQQLAAPVIAKVGLAKTYYVANFLRALSIGVMVFLLGTHAMPLTLMYAFYAFNGVVTGVAATADGTLRKIIIGSKPGSQERFRVFWQFTAEVVGVIAPIAFGTLVSAIGPSFVTAIYPATIVAGLMLLLAKKVMPTEKALLLGESTGFKSTVKGILATVLNALLHPFQTLGKLFTALRKIAVAVYNGAKAGLLWLVKTVRYAATSPAGAWKDLKEWARASALNQGFRLVWNTKILRYAFLGAAVFDIQNVFIYRLYAPGYGKLIAGAAGMSAIAGMIVGLFSLGGLILAGCLLLVRRHAQAKASAEGGTPAGPSAIERWQASLSRAVADGSAPLWKRALAKVVAALRVVGRFLAPVGRVLSAFGNRFADAAAKLLDQTPKAGEAPASFEARGVLRALLLGVPAVALLATFALTLPALGTVVALPAALAWAGALTVPAAALIVFGFFQVAASIKLNSFFVDNLPDPAQDPANKAKLQQGIAFEGSAMTAMSIVGMLSMKPMFGHLSTFNPFPYIAWATIPLALAIFFIFRKLSAEIKASAAAK